MTTELLTEKDASFFVGATVSAILYGTTIGQSLWYFSVFYNDSSWSLAFVATLLLLDTAHMAILCIAAYFTLIGDNNSSVTQNMLTWSIPSSIAITYGLTFAVQCFFVLRVWILSRRKKTITITIALLVVMQIASGTVTVAREAQNNVYYITDHTKIAATFELASCLLANVAITSVLVYYLQRGRIIGDNAWTTNPVINRLIFFTISTGLLTSIVTLANLVLFLAAPDSYYWVIPHVISSKLYVTSLLSTLNSRRSVRNLMIRNSTLYPSAPSKEMIARNSMPMEEGKLQKHRKPVRKGVREVFSEFIKRTERRLGDTSVEMKLLPGSPQPSKSGGTRSVASSPAKSEAISASSRTRDSGTIQGTRTRTNSVTWAPQYPREWQRESGYTDTNFSQRSSRFTALTFATTNNASTFSRHPYRASTLGTTTPVTPSSALNGFNSYSRRSGQESSWSESLKNRLSKSSSRTLPPVPPIPEASVPPPATTARKASTSFGPPPPPVAFTQLSRSSKFSRASGSSGASTRSTPRLGSLRFPSEIQLDEAFSRGDDWASSVGSGRLSLGLNRFN
ncbi:hypothetical protein SCHPADRAFT_368771 [Schizopora paradoxa]|uniref:DUF6534 domain-containing protein n=1 Tax=Schizopora paradoxa TaxID=27342 RepID=A0A0H2RMX7_9AGAM|nr:hypothetical protein SCHPADRAFT_368771 [Schizopora paradoxa]